MNRDEVVDEICAMLEGSELEVVKTIDSLHQKGDKIEIISLEDDELYFRGNSSRVGSDIWQVDWILHHLEDGKLETYDFSVEELADAFDQLEETEEEED